MLVVAMLFGAVSGHAAAQMDGKISRNVYRSPYAGATQFSMIVDYVDHGGSMDSRAVTRVCTGDVNTACFSDFGCVSVGGTCEYVLVAPADGIVCTIIEHFDDCGSSQQFGSFGNAITILHANGEASRHLHLKQWSVSQFGVTPGMFVTAGQPIAIEGDVGRSAGGQQQNCGTDGPPRVGTCLEEVPPGATNCYRHNHWNVIRYTTGELLQPLTCGIANNIYQSGTPYTAADCGTSGSYPTTATESSGLYSGFGTFKVVQAHNTVTAAAITVQNKASVVYRAGSNVRLQPGFQAKAGGYFRAESAPPDVTAASSWPIPDNCPCTGVVGFCFQWSDPSNPDGTSHGCSPAGPDFGQCHGCSIGGRCCPCVGNGTCEDHGICP